MRGLITLVLIAIVGLTACSKGKDLPPVEKLALFKAVGSGDADALKRALDAGVDPDLYHTERGYLITAAVWSHKPKLLEMLIAAGADVNAKKWGSAGDWAGGVVPLVDAILSGDCEMTRLLLQAGADPDEVLKKKHAAKSALTPAIHDKSARELYFWNKKESQRTPINTWDRNKACWLEVEKLMK